MRRVLLVGRVLRLNQYPLEQEWQQQHHYFNKFASFSSALLKWRKSLSFRSTCRMSFSSCRSNERKGTGNDNDKEHVGEQQKDGGSNWSESKEANQKEEQRGEASERRRSERIRKKYLLTGPGTEVASMSQNYSSKNTGTGTGTGTLDEACEEAVEFEEEKKRFTLNLKNGELARIEFEWLAKKGDDDEGWIEMYHTEVPKGMRGCGIGKVLAQGALKWAARERVKVKLSCSYLIEYVDRFGTQGARM